MLTKHIPSAIAVALAVFFGTVMARADSTTESGSSAAKLSIKPAVLTTTADQSGTPVTEVQYRRGYYRPYRYGYYRSYPYYGYSYRPYYSYSRPYYGGYYSSYRPYYRGYYSPRYYTGYRGFSVYGPRFSGSFYW